MQENKWDFEKIYSNTIEDDFNKKKFVGLCAFNLLFLCLSAYFYDRVDFSMFLFTVLLWVISLCLAVAYCRKYNEYICGAGNFKKLTKYIIAVVVIRSIAATVSVYTAFVVPRFVGAAVIILFALFMEMLFSRKKATYNKYLFWIITVNIAVFPFELIVVIILMLIWALSFTGF